jgi:hypothetical protein
MQVTFRLTIDRELLRQALAIAARERLSVDQFFEELMQRMIAEHESTKLPDHSFADRKLKRTARRKRRS